MELIKSKGMLIFFIVVLAITVVSSINTKKYNEVSNDIDKTYISMNTK